VKVEFIDMLVMLLSMNKLSLVGMQLAEKYKENFDVSSEGPSSGVTSQNSPYIFSGSCIPTNESLFILLPLHWHRQFKIMARDRFSRWPPVFKIIKLVN
jgi:hypothetical protein